MKNLISLYYVSSPSGKEKKMRKYLKEWFKKNVPTAQVYADQSGIYVTKGYAETFPCVVAHIDEVHDERNGSYRVVASGDYIFGYNVDNKKQQGIGADDKNGIWIAMQCLLRYDTMKVALFVGEEIGCVGSEKANMAFFQNCRFVIQCDRRGSNDFITSAGGQELCDEDFLIRFDMAKYGYKKSSGLMTDVMQLKENGLQVAACNLSCGYYNPHTDSETTIFSELCNCRDLVYDIIDNITEQCPHAPKRSYSVYSSSYYGSSYGSGLVTRRYGDGWEDGDYNDDDALGWYGDYTEEERIKQYNEMFDIMWNEMTDELEEFDLIEFYDTWKYTYPALFYRDFRDAFDDITAYGENYYDEETEVVEEDAKDDVAVVG